MSIFDKLFKREKEVFGKNEVVFLAEAMAAPTIKADGKYVTAGYFKQGKQQFVDLIENRTYKCVWDKEGILTVNGKQMIELENNGEVYSDNIEQNRFYRPLIKSKTEGYTWVDSVRVATGTYSDDMWLMFPNGAKYQKYFSFLLDEKGKLTKPQIKNAVDALNDSADYIVGRQIENENQNSL